MKSAATTRKIAAVKKMRLSISPLASSATLGSPNSSTPDFYKEVRTDFVEHVCHFPLFSWWSCDVNDDSADCVCDFVALCD